MIVLTLDPIIFSIGKLQVKWYGISYILGFFLGKMLLKKNIDNHISKFDKPRIHKFFKKFDSILLLSILCGGRLGYFILYQKGIDLTNVLKVYQGGMSFYGAVIAVLLSSYFFAKVYNVPYLRILDLVASVAPIGIFLGRCANFINQELYGTYLNPKIPWSTVFTMVDTMPRHPNQLYEALSEGILPYIMINITVTRFKALYKKGLVTLIFAITYSIARICTEITRDDQIRYELSCCNMNVTTAQVFSGITLLICIITILLTKIRQTKEIE